MNCPHCPCPSLCLRWSVFCAWAAEEPPDEVKLRHICNRSAVKVEYPPATAMAAGLARSLWDWAVSGFSMASDEEVGRRLAICSTCENWDAPGRRCRLCGCYTDAKVRSRVEKCPIGKW